MVVERVGTTTAYAQHSPRYDADAGGGLFATDEPVVADYLEGVAPGVALDAACGTGRFAEFLAGHRVVGVDSSPDMLAHARRRVPDGEFHLGELDRLPLPDDSVDVIVCSLALAHVPHLDRYWPSSPACCVRVATGHLGRAPRLITRGPVVTARGPVGEPCVVQTYRHAM